MRLILIPVLLVFFSCSEAINIQQSASERPKISEGLMKKMDTGLISINSGSHKYKVGVLYKKNRELASNNRSAKRSLIDVDFVELSKDEILSLSKDQNIQFIEEDLKVKVDLIYASKQIGARDAWNEGYTGATLGGTSEKIRIGVVDTGLDESHLDFSDAGKIAGTANCYGVTTCVDDTQNDDHGHGTHVAGIVLGGGNSCVGDDFYIEFDDTYPDVDLGNKHYFPVQFSSVPSVGGSLKADVTWVGALGSKANAAFLTEEESLKETPAFLINEQRTLVSAGPGVAVGEYGNYSLYNIVDAQNSYIVPYTFTTYTTQSAVAGQNYWARVKSTAQGWGDAFPRTGGISYGAQLFAVKALGSDGSGNVSDIVRALNYIYGIAQSKNIIAINLSFSLGAGLNSEIINSAVAELTGAGVVVVVSAGNEQQSGSVIGSPGDAAYSITVGAVNENDEITNYSSIGRLNTLTMKPDVVAPGGSIKGTDGSSYERLGILSAKTTYNSSTDPTAYSSWWNTTQGLAVDPYTTKVGTSQAAPMVAGLVGLMAQKHQGSWDFTSTRLPKLFKSIICMSAYETGARESDVFFSEAPLSPERAGGLKDRVEGYGRICTQGALSAFDAPWDVETSSSSSNFTFSTALGGQRTSMKELSLSSSKEYTFSMSVPSGSDFDLYLFSASPNDNGEPVLVASSALLNNSSKPGPERIIDYIPSESGSFYLVAKSVSGVGTSNFSLESSRAKPAEPTVISNLRINNNMRDKVISVSWDTNVPATSTVQYGESGGLEQEGGDGSYSTRHEFSFPVEYEKYYYLRVLSSSKGSSESDISTAVSAVYRVSAVTELVKDITVEDLPVIDAGGCGIISTPNKSGGGGLGNLLVCLLPLMLLLLLKARRRQYDKGLQLP